MTAGLVRREGETSLLQPFHKDSLYLFGVFTGFTKSDKIVGIPHNRPFPDELAPIVVFDADGLFHSVDSDVCQQGRRHSTLRGSLLRCMKRSMFYVSCF